MVLNVFGFLFPSSSSVFESTLTAVMTADVVDNSVQDTNDHKCSGAAEIDFTFYSRTVNLPAAISARVSPASGFHAGPSTAAEGK